MESTFSPEQNQQQNNDSGMPNSNSNESTKVTSSLKNPTASYVNSYECAMTAASQWWSYPGAMANNIKNIPSPDKDITQEEKPEGEVKDTKPKGSMSAYAFFVQTCHDEHKEEPNMTLAEFSKKCAVRWNAMNENEKQKFHEMAKQV